MARTAYPRFWSKVRVADGCWEWTGETIRRGYGRVRFLGRKVMATHAMWFIKYGRWPELQILHSCDNPRCVNPEHLSEGTQAENIRQCIERGRNLNANRTHCQQGHPFTHENTYRLDGRRMCRTCMSKYDRENPKIYFDIHAEVEP